MPLSFGSPIYLKLMIFQSLGLVKALSTVDVISMSRKKNKRIAAFPPTGRQAQE